MEESAPALQAVLAHNVDLVMSILFITKTQSVNSIAINVTVVVTDGALEKINSNYQSSFKRG